MKAFSFVHTGDLHLDSPFKGISEISESLRSVLVNATFNSFNGIIDLCIEKKVDFLLISGDIYDGLDKSLRAQLKFRDGLKRLSEVGINVYVVYGNHDPLDGWSVNLNLPENVHIFSGKSVEKITVKKNGEEIAQICGISFPTREIKINLSNKFPKISNSEKTLYTIGLLHCNVGSNTGHYPYAPCTLQDLISRNFDYWALGHIHKKSILNEENPVIIYSGNSQGLSPKECGAKGCFLVNVNAKGETTYDFIEVDSVRWFVEELLIDGLSTVEDFIFKLNKYIEEIRKKANGRKSICRIILSGRGQLHATITKKGVLDDILQEIRENEKGEKQFVWVESFVNNTNPEIDRNSLLNRKNFIGDLINLFEEFYSDAEKISELKKSLEPLFNSSGGRKFLKSIDDEHFLDLIKKAETLCLDNLIKEKNL